MGPSYGTFGNTTISQGFDFTFAPGVTPSVCYIRTVPHAPVPFHGDLRLTTDGDVTLQFPNCILESPRLDSSTGGSYETYPILDRRWKWQFAYVHESLNILKPDGSYLRETAPQEIAAILLSAMGESGFDVSQLPNDSRPTCHWEDGVRADIELEKLCAELGCIITLNYHLNRAEIHRLGVGVALPAGPQEGASYTPVKAATPQRIRVEAGKTLFQDTFALEAVGLDIDDQWKHIDDLSYKPANGWGWITNGMARIDKDAEYTLHGRTLKVRDLAEATVFRCYRMANLLRGGWVPEGMAFSPLQPSSIRDFELFDELADEEISGRDGGLRRLPAVLYARYYRGINKQTPPSPIRYPGGFNLIDATHGIVQASEPLFINAIGGAQPATVYYECSFHAGQDGVMHRLNLENQVQSSPVTPTRLISRPEILFRSIQRYSNITPLTVEDNFADAHQRLQYWYDAALLDYPLQQGGTIHYAKLMPITLDGLTQQVTWSASNTDAARTTASQAQRHNRYIPTLDQQRDRLLAKQNEKTLDEAMTVLRGSRAASGVPGGGLI